jgi:LysM repeat protein
MHRLATVNPRPSWPDRSSLVFGKRFRKLRLMLSRVLLGCALTAPAFAQTAPSSVELANLREDVRGLVQRVGELSLRVEQLERENGDLRKKTAESGRAYATVVQLNDAVSDLNAALKTAVASSQNDTLLIVSRQLEKLGRQTNAALDSLAKSSAARPAASAPPTTPTFSDDYPKDGINYLVQKGDSLASIAKKTGAKQQDIVNANKISDPSLIRVGQTLIIPGAK